MPPDFARRVRLVRSHCWLLTGAVVLQSAVKCALFVIPLPTIRRAGRRLRPLLRIVLPGRDEAVVWAMDVTGRRLGSFGTCLVRALSAEMRLSSSERRVRLVIGIKRSADGGLQSHAWLRDRDRVLIGGPIDGALTSFAEWESAA